MEIANEDIREVVAEIPQGHKHIRTKIILDDGAELVFREAAIANIVRAYITIKTHPGKSSVRLVGKKMAERKDGFAEWQLVEES